MRCLWNFDLKPRPLLQFSTGAAIRPCGRGQCSRWASYSAFAPPWFQQQFNKSDPANKSLCFSGFKSTSANVRDALIRAVVSDILPEDGICQIEYVFSGSMRNSKIFPICIWDVPITQIVNKSLHYWIKYSKINVQTNR